MPPTPPAFSLQHIPLASSVLGQVFAPIRGYCAALPDCPSAEDLSDLALAQSICTAQGQALRFTPPTEDGWGYEMRIAQFGCVETRAKSWHDFFNALVWLRFPHAKAALSAAHYAAMPPEGANFVQGTPQGIARGQRRDALTHFDECGVVLVGRNPALLDMVQAFRWRELFWDNRPAFSSFATLADTLDVVIFGHATYEQLLQPFRGLTAKAILLHLPPDHVYWQATTSAEQRWAFLDSYLADYFNRPTLTRPRDLHPFPLLGLPGLVPENAEASYYDDTWQFRTGRKNHRPRSFLTSADECTCSCPLRTRSSTSAAR